MKYVIPILVAALLAYALIRRVNPYEAFIRGAADAVPTLLRVLPALAAMLGAITLLRGCGALDALGNWLSPVFEKIGIPSELTPLILLRPFSGSASLALLGDTLTRYGADSFRSASVQRKPYSTHWLCIAVPSASPKPVMPFLPRLRAARRVLFPEYFLFE